MSGIFISYRRRGSQGFAGRLADDLIDHFGQERVFRDVEIQPGNNFTEAIESGIASCSALLVVIGPRWLAQRSAAGTPRLHEPGDWVRLEIEAALVRHTWVIPILVGGAQMPAALDLPDSIQPLSRIQAFEMSDRRWDRDVEQLAAMITRRIPGFAKADTPINKNRQTGHSRPVDSPARAIRDVVMRVIEEFGRARRESPASRRPTSRLRTFVGSRLARLTRQLIGIAIALGVAYFLVQNYADANTRRLVNDIIARLTALL